MAKKVKIEEQIIDIDLEKDKQLIIKLRRVTKPIQSEIDEIFYLYKKYIDPNAQMYCGGCDAGPMNSIVRYYWKVVKLDENNLVAL